jgi:hypothetical protein
MIIGSRGLIDWNELERIVGSESQSADLMPSKAHEVRESRICSVDLNPSELRRGHPISQLSIGKVGGTCARRVLYGNYGKTPLPASYPLEMPSLANSAFDSLFRHLLVPPRFFLAGREAT